MAARRREDDCVRLSQFQSLLRQGHHIHRICQLFGQKLSRGAVQVCLQICLSSVVTVNIVLYLHLIWCVSFPCHFCPVCACAKLGIVQCTFLGLDVMRYCWVWLFTPEGGGNEAKRAHLGPHMLHCLMFHIPLEQHQSVVDKRASSSWTSPLVFSSKT